MQKVRTRCVRKPSVVKSDFKFNKKTVSNLNFEMMSPDRSSQRHTRKMLHSVAQPTSSFTGSSKSDIKTPSHFSNQHNARDMEAMEGRFAFRNSNSQEESWDSTLPDLPVPEGWSHESIHAFPDTQVFTGAPVQYSDGLPTLPGIVNRYLTSNHNAQAELDRKDKGWQGPGPGPNRGTTRVPQLQSLQHPFLLAILHLAREAIHFQQLYSYQSLSSESTGFDFTEGMSMLRRCELDIPVSKTMKKNIWSLTHQLGVPAFLLKLRSPQHAIAITFLTDRPGQQWRCSYCGENETSTTSNCSHVVTVRDSVGVVARQLACTEDFLIESMVQSAAFQHITDLPRACFYGHKGNLHFAIVRSEREDYTMPMASTGRLHVLKRMSISHGWKCLHRACSGYSTRCIHCKPVHTQVKQGINHCFCNIHELQAENVSETSAFDNNQGFQDDDIPPPRFNRPVIPSEHAFQVDFSVNKDARNNARGIIRAARNCHCGLGIRDGASSALIRTNVRVETTRCFVTYEQEIWTCGNNHLVLPEQDDEQRDGLVWISRDTAYTEVFLFELLLQMTSNGTTLSSQSEIRSQILFLQTDYMSRQRAPRSTHSLRKALTTYAMEVVQSLPPWVFRCNNCSVVCGDRIYYDKLSFDGQQLGFNIRKDVRYDFYGKPAVNWRRPVERCTDAWNAVHLIRSKDLRTVVMETLRIREVTASCNSVQTMCRTMMKIPLRSQNSIRAAVAAIKLFDPGWQLSIPTGTPLLDDSNYQSFCEGNDPNLFAHPIQFVVDLKSVQDFNAGKTIITLFRSVLDCKKGAMIISVLLNGLRTDLKDHIPIHDKVVVENYSSTSHNSLNVWLLRLSQINSWGLSISQPAPEHVGDNLSSGIAEYAESLDHPFRAPFSWKHSSENSDTIIWDSTKISHVRSLDNWMCPDEAQILTLLFLMAVLTESVTVWLRNGDLKEILAAQEVLRNAELFCGHSNVQYHYRASLRATFNISILYEGLMGILGANVSSASPMFAALREVLQLINQRYESYVSLMRSTSTKKSFMSSPKEFDNMLRWTGAFSGSDNEQNLTDGSAAFNRNMEHQNMRQLYGKIAASKSNDFLETGIWAPDFPITRPSPSAAMWGADLSHTESSCSKEFNTQNAFSPGTFGGYCMCQHAKTVLISFLKQPEGCRMPLNIIVERCKRLPRYVIYDFACGTQRAAIGMSSEITRNVHFVIDPFHFPGHKTCSLAMHESSFSDLRGSNFESQEQRNSAIKLMERSLRACKDVHFMHYIILAHAYQNLKATFRDFEDNAEEESTTQWGDRAWLQWIRDFFITQQRTS